MRNGHLKLMPIVRMKLWAKRAVARVKGYHHSSGRSEKERALVHKYIIAATDVSGRLSHLRATRTARAARPALPSSPPPKKRLL